MKFYRICGFGAFALALGLVACGDDGSTNGPSNNHEDSNVSSVTSEDDLPSCTEGRDGSVNFVDGTKEGFVCKDRKWLHYDMLADSEENLPGCTGAREGLAAYLYEENRELKCVDGVWEKVGEEAGSSSSVTPNSSSSVILSDSEGSSSSVASSSSTKSSSSSALIEDLSSSSSIKVPEPAEGSSSSVASSSSVESSSSVASSSSIKYGSLIDSRDGQVYKTIKIGTQTWMAENLNYAYTGVKYNYNGYTSDSTSWCYDDDPSNCVTYGRLYTWAAAMDSAGIVDPSGASKGCGLGVTCTVASASSATLVRGVCSEGWHLPSDAEWRALYTNVGGTGYAGKKLKANTSLWSSNTGTDEFGFSVLPAGRRNDLSGFDNRGGNAYFWSSTEGEYNSSIAWRHNFNFDYDNVRQNYIDKSSGFSVRCLKD